MRNTVIVDDVVTYVGLEASIPENSWMGTLSEKVCSFVADIYAGRFFCGRWVSLIGAISTFGESVCGVRLADSGLRATVGVRGERNRSAIVDNVSLNARIAEITFLEWCWLVLTAAIVLLAAEQLVAWLTELFMCFPLVLIVVVDNRQL